MSKRSAYKLRSYLVNLHFPLEDIRKEQHSLFARWLNSKSEFALLNTIVNIPKPGVELAQLHLSGNIFRIFAAGA